MEFYVKNTLISIVSVFFLVSDHDFVIYIDFTHVTASNTSVDNVTN